MIKQITKYHHTQFKGTNIDSIVIVDDYARVSFTRGFAYYTKHYFIENIKQHFRHSKLNRILNIQ